MVQRKTNRPLRDARQRLIRASEKVFGQRGYTSATIAEITRLAGTGLGTFYEYFPSKESLFAQLVEYMSHETRAYIAKAVERERTRLEKELAGFRAFFRFERAHINLYRIVMQSQFVNEDLYRTYYRRLADGYVSGLADAQARGEVDSGYDPEALAWILMGAAQFLGMRYVLWEHREPPAAAQLTLSTVLGRILSRAEQGAEG